jgi:hypothetical protein
LRMNIGTIGKLQAFILHILPCDALQSINRWTHSSTNLKL